MDSENNHNHEDKPGEETAGNRLRRILASHSNKQQELSDISSTPENEEHELSAGSENDANPPAKDALENEQQVQNKILADFDKKFASLGKNFKTFVEEFRQHVKDFLGSVLSKKPAKSQSAGQGSKPPRKIIIKDKKSCLIYTVLGFLLVAIMIAIIILSFLIIQYFRIAADLPSVDNLADYASQFETTRIYDRNGSLIYEIIDPTAGRRTYVPLDEVSPYVIAATIATEDKDFFTNPGFDPWGIMRALWQNYTSGRVVSGASTVTQQLARTLLLSPEERAEVSTRRKAREIVLAAEITRKYSKDEILELYLNENNYGNLAYGIEAAAETYFNTSADQLDLAQASFLAGLPQAPAIYDVFTNREASLLRHLDVLNLMYQLSSERSCIDTVAGQPSVCVSLEDAVSSAQAIENYPFVQRLISMPYPHWVNFIRQQLESQYDAQTIYRSGFKVYTTLDPDMQEFTQSSLQEQVNALQDNDATNGAVVVLKPGNGEILAMVGSADFFNADISGQVNMALAPRQPGSSIKPLTYAAAFEKGWTPSTLIWDVPSEFPPSGNPDDPREPYKPVNYDSRFHGPVLVRTALGSSYNIPAVKALDFIGIYDDPNTAEIEGLVAFAERLGITTLTREDYGLSLTLGGGDVTLLELTQAYAVFANQGRSVEPFAITRIVDHFGQEVYEHESAPAQQLIDDDHVFLINDILSDNSARTPAFGSSSILNLPFSAAVKTGTTNDFRDNWTLGYTPDIAVGVWIGNADYSPMKNISGVSGAGPLWNTVMQQAIERYAGGSPMPFNRPDSIKQYEICRVSGTAPSDKCSLRRTEIFAENQPPEDSSHDLWQEIAVDTWTNLKASSACSEFTEEKLTLNVTEKWAVKWLTQNESGKKWLEDNGFSQPVIFTPERECTGDDPRPTIVFVGLQDDTSVTASPLDIYAVVNATANFESFKLQYGVGNNPSKWKTLLNTDKQYKEPTKLITWDVYEANASRITLRIVVRSTQGTEAEKRIQINLDVPTPTPTITPTPTETPLPTPTLEPTSTIAPTATSEGPLPSETPTP
jgi:penicillin-binding protein 1C